MRVTIYYCKTCHFEAPARAIAEALEQELGLTSELRKAFWGTFKIELDGREVFNRWHTRGWLGRLGLGRTPKPPEIVDIFRRELAQSQSTATKATDTVSQ